MHHVGDVGEIARLAAVAINRRLAAGQHGGDEQRDHGRVLAVRILPRAKDVEVADRHGLETVRVREGLAVEFGGQLGGAIRRERGGQIGLAFRRRRLIAIGAARAGIDQSPHAGLLRLVQQVERAGDAGRVGVQRPLDAARHAGQRGIVKDAIDAAHGLGHRGRIGDVGFDEFDPVANRGQVAQVAGAQVVEHPHPIAARDQRLGNVRANETCRRR